MMQTKVLGFQFGDLVLHFQSLGKCAPCFPAAIYFNPCYIILKPIYRLATDVPSITGVINSISDFDH